MVDEHIICTFDALGRLLAVCICANIGLKFGFAGVEIDLQVWNVLV